MTFDTIRRGMAAWVLVAAASAAVLAQQDDRARALEQQIDRIYQANEYALPRFGPARWLADGTAYTTVERTTGRGGSDIVRYDAATGDAQRADFERATDSVRRGAPLAIADYVWSDDAHQAADLHQHAEGVAPEHARRLLGADH